ncbi:MAG: alpha/beta hydrolase [Gammaproteobacteria bacterium]|nr:alpha/beta hydrolase [Gammaproteobacteria bacterium]
MAFIENAHAKVYYESHGDGPALVFAHGAGGNAASWWQQMSVFVERYKVIAFDHRTFGRSECAVEHFKAEHFANDVRAILDAEGVERAAFVCQSMGGWTGSRVAIETPERVSALVMSHTPGCFTSEEITKLRNSAMRTVNRDELPPGRFSHWALAPDFHEKNPAAAYLYTQISGLNTGFSRAALASLVAPEVLVPVDSLSDYRVPTLFITASQDLIFPPALIEMVAKAVPGAQYTSLGDAGHSSYFESPDAFNQRLEEFLARHWPA